MRAFLQLRPVARAYVTVVVLAGAMTVAQSVHDLYIHPIGRQWFILAVLTLLTGSFTVKVPSINASLSVSETFVFASVLLFGPAAGAITVLLECLIIQFWMKPSARLVHRVLFNTAAPAIAIWLSGYVFFWTTAASPYAANTSPLEVMFVPLVIFTALYFLLNSWLVAVALGFETNQSPLDIWWKNFTWLSVNYFSGASVAALLVTYTHRLDLRTLLVIVPLLVVSYLTFRTAMGRVEDSNLHLSELNRLYLSTIETLAMAIDAKDQVTHGHIRRVQSYATGLAKELGVRDVRLIKAIEAAALLHDMGKLAVPEHILNKPGKLTEPEFEKMKLHASVGADILSAIDFPYPVVPIVRHHHENWNGTGYPTGLKGTDIPVGARILSVVDCFDALTSDRPYRPKLSDDEALQILIERRGSMYDPLVVDTFVAVYRHLAPEPTASGPPSAALNEIAGARNASSLHTSPAALETSPASADDILGLYQLARALSGSVSAHDAIDAISHRLRKLVPWSLAVFFVNDSRSGELEARHAVGEGAVLVAGLRIPIGERLSGWVAANRRTIANSDPVLDLGDLARSQSLKLRSCISAPLCIDDCLIGVLSLYSNESNRFSDDHRRIIEAVATQIAHTVAAALEFERAPRRDAVTGLPGLDQLEQLVRSDAVRNAFGGPNCVLLLITVTNLELIATTHGRAAKDEVLTSIVDNIRGGLRIGDILFKNGDREFVALLNTSDGETGSAVATRLRHRVSEHPVRLSTGALLHAGALVTIVMAPRHPMPMEDLLASARARLAATTPERPGTSVH